MCYQWCFVQRWIINNDEPCGFCAVRDAHADDRCDGSGARGRRCRHYIDRAGDEQARCHLTAQPVPRALTCCHHDADTVESGLVMIGHDNIAPGLLAQEGCSSARELLEYIADDAYDPGGDAVAVWIEDLALPEVYGVEAWLWDDAIDWGDDADRDSGCREWEAAWCGGDDVSAAWGGDDLQTKQDLEALAGDALRGLDLAENGDGDSGRGRVFP